MRRCRMRRCYGRRLDFNVTADSSLCLYGVCCVLKVDTLRPPGWRDVAAYPPSCLDGLSESFPTPPPTSMRNLAADGYAARTAELDASLRQWGVHPGSDI